MEGRKDITRRSQVSGISGGHLAYSGDRTHGLAWTSGVWLFMAEAPGEPQLAALISASRAGGQAREGMEGLIQRHFIWLFAGLFVLALLGTFAMMNFIARRQAVPPREGVIPASRLELLHRLLALNDHQRPFMVSQGEKRDLVAEWKIVDAAWWEIFARAGLRKVYRLFLSLDEDRREVRAIEQKGTVEWVAGAAGLTPKVHFQSKFFQGITLFDKERGFAYGWKSMFPPQVGTIYQGTRN